MADPTPAARPDDTGAAAPAPLRPRADDERLSTAEGAELMRQGAKAAARGEPSGNNPLDAAVNRPGMTGEGERLWADRHAAWQRGHRTQASPAPRPASADADGAPTAEAAEPPVPDASGPAQ